MASKPVPPIKSPLVSKARAIIAAIAVQTAALKETEDELIKLGAGRYCSESDEKIGCTVVAATEDTTGAVSYSLPSEVEGEKIARDLAGISFGKLFDRSVVYTPCEGFELLAPKLLTPGRSLKLTQLCLVPGKVTKGKAAHLRWSK
ncbi:MAG: hypothetical protein V4710_06055 [Verrucomicrobiota bacterium]